MEQQKQQREEDKKAKEMRSYKLLETDNEQMTTNHFDNESDAERELIDDFM